MMSIDVFLKALISPLTSLAIKELKGKQLKKSIDKTVHEAFTNQSQNLLALCLDETFSKQIFRLAGGMSIDAKGLIDLGMGVAKNKELGLFEEEILGELKEFALKLINIFEEIAPESGKIPSAFSNFVRSLDTISIFIAYEKENSKKPAPAERFPFDIKPVQDWGENMMQIGDRGYDGSTDKFHLHLHFFMWTRYPITILNIDLRYPQVKGAMDGNPRWILNNEEYVVGRGYRMRDSCRVEGETAIDILIGREFICRHMYAHGEEYGKARIVMEIASNKWEGIGYLTVYGRLLTGGRFEIEDKQFSKTSQAH